MLLVVGYACCSYAAGQKGQQASLKPGGAVPFRATIVDPTGAVIPEAHLTLTGEPSGNSTSSALPTRRTVSNAAGEIHLRILPGLYRVRLSHAGFESLDREIAITTAAIQDFHFVLPIERGATAVRVRSGGFAAGVNTTTAHIPLSVLETPQQVQVLTASLLRSRAVESMKQALEVIPAVGLQLGEGRRDNFYIRGFNAQSDMYIDGVRDDAQYYRDLSNTERIEVIEGPAAALYGRGSSGGLINRITKKPRMEGTLIELDYTVGSYGHQRGVGDIDTLVPGTRGKLGFRLTGAAEHSGSHRHFYWMDRYTFAPTLRWVPTDKTSMYLQIERLRDDRLPDRGIPYIPATGAPADVPVETFYGYVGKEPGSNFIHTSVTGGTYSLRHTFDSGWVLHEVARRAGYFINFDNMYPSSVIPQPGGSYLVARGQYNGWESWNEWFNDVEAYRQAKWFGLEQMFLVGMEYGHELRNQVEFQGPTNQTPVDIYNPAMVPPILSSVMTKNYDFLARTAAFYVQDLVTLAPKWQAMVGVRYDNLLQDMTFKPPTNTIPNLNRTDNAGSPRVGIVYRMTSWSSLYGNYSRTFDPSGENLSLAVNNAELQPEVTQNLETGGKFSLLHGKLLATASLFRLDRTNIKTTDPNDPTKLLNVGEQLTKGAELNFQGNLSDRWSLYGGYAWLDGRIVASNTVSNGVLLQGKRPQMTALNNGSLWTTYQYDNGFGFGGGVIAKSAQFPAFDNLAKLPGFARVDGTIFYRTHRYEIQGNMFNIGDIRYFDAAQSDYQIYPGAPVSGSVTIRYRF